MTNNRKTKRKIISLLLCGILLFPLCPMWAFAEGAGTGGTIGESTTADEILGYLGGAGNVTVEGKTITLTTDITLSAAISFTGGDWTLNMNGMALKGEDGRGVTPLVMNGGNLTITGTGTFRGGQGGRSEKGGSGILCQSGRITLGTQGVFTAEGGKCVGISKAQTKAGEGIQISGGGRLCHMAPLQQLEAVTRQMELKVQLVMVSWFRGAERYQAAGLSPGAEMAEIV